MMWGRGMLRLPTLAFQQTDGAVQSFDGRAEVFAGSCR